MPASRPARPVLRLITGGAARRTRATTASRPVRWEKIRAARARISAGYYDRPDVRERVLAAVLGELEDE